MFSLNDSNLSNKPVKHLFMLKRYLVIAFISLTCNSFAQSFQTSKMDQLLYGVAYYYEYMPSERLEEDARMMKECGINVVRICESTWSYMEPQEGVFNLGFVTKVLDVMHKNGIRVIVGTPTYAIPSWLALKFPAILAVTQNGQNKYGSRQNMDITNPDFRFYSERIIRKLMALVCNHPAVIGYQADNETKHYGTAGENVQVQFVTYLQTKFATPTDMSNAFGLNYWSNSVFAWKDMPSVTGTINGSLGCEFSVFQRKLVTDYLAWQVAIINEYKKPGQFVTQNFDLEWKNASNGIQPDVDHFEASKPFDIAGIDIYHRTEDKLDGVTIGLAGDLARSMKQDNYLVIETQAQSILNNNFQELPYPGQLRLQAFSHIASGANMVAYWPWHSIHNGLETYWKGILSHDMAVNPTYLEAKQIGTEFREFGNSLINLKKNNKVAIYFSNESLTALNWFKISNNLTYNDVLRKLYEVLYKMNIECDFIDHTTTDISQYNLIVVPALYVAKNEELERLNKFVENGGHVVYTFKSGFSNEFVKVRTDKQPAVIQKSCGVSYQQFTNIEKLALKDNPFQVDSAANFVSEWAELLTAEGAKVLASYDHPWWGKYAAITMNNFGKGTVTYLGCWPSVQILDKVLKLSVKEAGIELPEAGFPVIIRCGINKNGKKVHYFLNYSSKESAVKYAYRPGIELFSNKNIVSGEILKLQPWNLIIVEEE
jgi:beta-galactosidase